MTAKGEGSEDSDEISVVGVAYTILTHRRQRYRFTGTGHVLTAPAPAKLIPGGRHAIDRAVHIAEQTYLDDLRLERQARAMERAGLKVTSQTLWDEVDVLAAHLEATCRALLREVLGAEIVCAEETEWLLVERTGTSTWWTWCVVSDQAASCRVLPSRSKIAVAEVLLGDSGVEMSDGRAACNDFDAGDLWDRGWRASIR